MGGGKNPDGVKTYPADEHDLDSYRLASERLAQLRAPTLLDSSDPHARLFVAAFDGTGNSMYDGDPKNHTNVADLVKQIQNGMHDNIGVGYVEGPGTQSGFFRSTLDAATGRSFEPRVEKMYAQFIEQAKQWKADDPQAKIGLAGIGFSRGAEQEAAFSRLVHERGIQDPAGAKYSKDKDGNITGVEYSKPPLVAPGQVAQAVGLFDPVGTGEPRHHDRRLPPSVMSAFQITAEDERRDQFKSTSIVRDGFAEDKRFLNVTVGGAHSNIGGSYELNGLSIRSGNLMVDYLNGLSDRPYLAKRAEPEDPKLNVVHRSEQHLIFYTTRGFRDGVRDRVDEVASKEQIKHGSVADPRNKEPIDANLDARLERRPVTIGPIPGGESRITAGRHAHEGSPIDQTFARLVDAARNRDDGAFRAATQEHAQTQTTQAWLQGGREQHQQMQADRAAPQQPASPPQQPLPPEAPPNPQPRAPGP
ncbi:phospholipase effector Tle1 domain-containing protein [Lysobacter sp. CA199]|uniref:phospholipase effector Tle1 domain-containing protein n=1 Tax=Lysobacter sp. CA199 TaxID=3455608 RepID=UPI003F8D2C59